MKILVLDNYDSFTFNLVHYIESVSDADVIVMRNDEIKLDDLNSFDKIVLSPGPGLPSEAGIMNNLIKKYAPSKSILGVCLGQQAIGEVFGASLKNLNTVFHGVATPIEIIVENELFKNIPKKINVGRYHSWVIDRNTIPDELEVIAIDADKQVMAIRHKKYKVYGVQFHPESILSEYGKQIIKNWLEI